MMTTEMNAVSVEPVVWHSNPAESVTACGDAADRSMNSARLDGGSRPNADGTTGRSPLWTPESGRSDSVEHRAWSSMSEFSIWGPQTVEGGSHWDDKTSMDPGSLSSMLQSIACDGLAGLAKTGSDAPVGKDGMNWSENRSLSNRNGGTDSLGLSDVGRGSSGWLSGLGYQIGEGSAFRPFSNNGDGWALPGKPANEPKSAAADWGVSAEKPAATAEPSKGWPSGGNNEKPVEQSGPWAAAEPSTSASHGRSSSSASDPSTTKETSVTETPVSSTGDAPPPIVPPEPQLSAKDLLIAKMVNSNEGWGTKPIRQDTPWVIETTSTPVTTSVTTTTAEDNQAAVAAAAAKIAIGQAVNTAKDVPGNGQYWGGVNPASNSTEWNADVDIGVWSGPPPPEAISQNIWGGAAKLNVADLAGLMAAGPAPAVGSGWSDAAGSFASLPPGVIDKLAMGVKDGSVLLDKGRGVPDNSWMNSLSGGQKSSQPSSAGWISGDSGTSSGWGSSHASDMQETLLRAPPVLSGAQQQRFGSGGSRQFDMSSGPLKIDTWNEPGPGAESLTAGHWGQQPPVNPGANFGGLGNPVDAHLQQLMKHGLKKEEAFQLLVASNPELLGASRPGTALGDMAPQQRGRMLRGQSVGEMPGADVNSMFSQMSGRRLPPQQMAGMKGAGMGLPIMHQKQQSGGGTPNWQQLSGFQGVNPSSGGTQPTQMSPQMSELLIQLQTILQPKLQMRANLQQNRNMTPQQKRQHLDQLNAEIAVLKQQIDHLQIVNTALGGGTQPSLADITRTLTAPPPHMGNAGSNNDNLLLQQFLSQMKLEQDAGPAHFPGGNDFGAMGRSGNEFMLQGSMPPPSMAPNAKGLDALFADGWPNAGAPPSRFPYPDAGGMHNAARLPMPPGLGADNDGSSLWNRGLNASWGIPGDKTRIGAGTASGGSSQMWLFLTNFTVQVDGPIVQCLCMQHGLLQAFFFNKSTMHALACYVNREEAVNARAQFGTIPFGNGNVPLCAAELIPPEFATQLLGSQPNAWVQLQPPSMAPPLKPRAAAGNSNIWAAPDGM